MLGLVLWSVAEQGRTQHYNWRQIVRSWGR